ncbi:MAG: hypothetical protein M3Z84_00545 [Actinomycetota bacterium]|nr:hypothetical protein [Actinomycetota bacterium]
MTGEQLLLVVGLGAPLAAAVVLSIRSAQQARRILQGAALVSATAWAALLAVSSTARLGGLHAGPLVASSACGAALLLLSVDGDAPGRRTAVMGGFCLFFVQLGLAGGGGGGHGGALVGGLAAGALCGVAASWDPARVSGALTPPAAALGVAAIGVGIFLVHDQTGDWLLPPGGTGTATRGAVIALILGAAALCVAGGLRPGRSTVVLLAGGLGVGVRAGPILGLGANVAEAAPGTSEGLAGLALALAAAALVAALLRKPPLAIALLALAVAAGPLALVPASRLLAAAAVLSLAIDRRPAWLLAVPGVAALVVGAIDAGSALAIACAGAVAIVGTVIAGGDAFDRAGGPDATYRRFDPGSVPAFVAGAWLLLAPARWTWAGAQKLHYYDVGAARACAAGLIAAVLAVAWTNRGTDQPETEAPELVRSEGSAS